MRLDLIMNFFDMTPKLQATKEIIDELGFIKITIKALCIKGHYQKNEKTTHRMGENICKSFI